MLTNDQETLIKSTFEDLRSQIVEPDNLELLHVRQSAFDLYLPETGESVQVHITITRDETDFLSFLQTECMS